MTTVTVRRNKRLPPSIPADPILRTSSFALANCGFTMMWMKNAGLGARRRDQGSPPAEYVRQARKETVVVTLHGKPVATVTAVPKDADWESLAISRHPKFLKIMARSKRRHEKEGGLSSDELRAHFGIKAKSARKSPRRTR